MKKLFLAVAVLATSVFVANAAHNTCSTGTAVAETTDAVTGKVTEDGIEITYQSVEGKKFKYEPTAGVDAPATAGRLNFGGSGSTAKFTAVVGDEITVIIASGGDNAGLTRGFDVAGGDVTEVMAAAGKNEPTVCSFNATATEITLTVKGGGMYIYDVYINEAPASDNNAISKDLLYKAGEELVNTTGLEVSIYTVSGVKVLTSSEAAINISGLQSGAYVASTEKGFLKFVK